MKQLILTFTAGFKVLMVLAQPTLPPPPVALANNLATITTNFRVNNTIAPGVVIKIYHPDNWEWSFADGIRNIATSSPATPDLVFRAASISKIFCATAILKLASEGTLNLDDNIGNWLPAPYVNQIENNDQITIRTLLNHTSSLDEPQFGTSLANNFLAAPEINYRDSILQIIANQGGLASSIGNFYYSNANFNLLAEIVKNASGTSYQDYLQQNIIEPIGLTHTYLDTLPVSTGFNGYVPCNSLPNCTLPDVFTLLDYSQANVGWGYGAADISSSTKDLIKFYYALQNGQIIPQSWVDAMTENTVDAANSFQDKRYGFGTMLFQRNDNTIAIGHTGTAASHANLLCQLKPSNIYISFSFNIIRMNRELFLDQIENYLSTVTAVIENEINPRLTIFPNPAKDNLMVLVPENNVYQCTVFNALGKQVKTQTLFNAENNIELTGLQNGIYFVSILDNKGNLKTEKLLIEK